MDSYEKLKGQYDNITRKQSRVWVVTMYRWGDREKHSYVLGVYKRKEAASKAGVAECEYRGGKYNPEVVEFYMDEGLETATVILKLELHPYFAK